MIALLIIFTGVLLYTAAMNHNIKNNYQPLAELKTQLHTLKGIKWALGLLLIAGLLDYLIRQSFLTRQFHQLLIGHGAESAGFRKAGSTRSCYWLFSGIVPCPPWICCNSQQVTSSSGRCTSFLLCCF